MLVLMTDWRPSAVTRISDSAEKYKRQITANPELHHSNHSKNSVRGNVGTEDQLKDIGSDTHLGFCREVQKTDNSNPRASSFQPPTRHFSAVWRIFVTRCGDSSELVHKSTFTASCFENAVVDSILGNDSSSSLRPHRLCSHPGVQLTLWGALSLSVKWRRHCQLNIHLHRVWRMTVCRNGIAHILFSDLV